MSERDDDMTRMPEPPLDENAADGLLSGARPASEGLTAVADLLDDLRETASEPPPPPSPALSSVLRDGLPGGAPAHAHTAERRDHPRRQPGWRRVVAPIGIGLTLTAGSLTVAAAAELLPDPAQRVVAGVVNALTPLELPEPGPAGTPSGPPGSGGRGTHADTFVGREGRSPGTPPGGASPGAAPGTGEGTPIDVPSSPGGTSLPSGRDGGLEPFPDPPGAPSAATPTAPLPGAPTGDLQRPLPLPPPTVGTPNPPAAPTTPPFDTPATSLPARLPAP